MRPDFELGTGTTQDRRRAKVREPIPNAVALPATSEVCAKRSARNDKVNGALSAASSRHAGCIERSRENLAKCSATLMSSSRLHYPYLHTPYRYTFSSARASYPVLRFLKARSLRKAAVCLRWCSAAHATFAIVLGRMANWNVASYPVSNSPSVASNLTLGTGRDVPQKRR